MRTRPGNRFVGLLNRFIVAVSRARLGCYVVGSIEAVDGASHWKRFLKDLTAEGVPDTAVVEDDCPGLVWSTVNKSEGDSSEDEESDVASEVLSVKEDVKPNPHVDNTYHLNRVSASLPICCPRHRSRSHTTVDKVTSFPTNDNWSQFCKLPCDYVMPECGHKCDMLCHSPTFTVHTKICKVSMDRPCDVHIDRKLPCGELRGAYPTVKAAIDKFKCDIPVQYRRPECSHSVNVTCHEHTLLTQSKATLDPCAEIVDDYHHPKCNHTFKAPKCYERRQYEKKAPPCLRPVEYKRKCGCTLRLKCHEMIAEMESTVPTKCMEDVNVQRPRCGHVLSLRCHKGTYLRDTWEELNPQHEPCKNHDRQHILVKSDAEYGCDETNVLSELPKCSVPVVFAYPCGHLTRIPCNKAFDYAKGVIPLERCDTKVDITSPLCKHPISIPCWAKGKLEEWAPWESLGEPPVDEAGVVIPETAIQHNRTALPNEYLKILKTNCINRTSKVLRMCNPSHKSTYNCSFLLDLINNRTKIDNCKFEVIRKLTCNHDIKVLCHERFTEPPPICRAPVTDFYCYPCNEHKIPANTCNRYQQLLCDDDPQCPFQVRCVRYRCSHPVTVKCFEKDYAVKPLRGYKITDVDRDEAVLPNTVYAEEMYCATEENIAPCTDLVSYQQTCGHLKEGVPCHLAFNWASGAVASPACEIVCVGDSPLCSHALSIYCSTWKRLEEWQPWPAGAPEYNLITESIDNEGFPITVAEYPQASLELPSPPPVGVPYEALDCQTLVRVARDCGHILRMCCVEIYKSKLQFAPCMEQVEYTCADCNVPKSSACSAYNPDLTSGQHAGCTTRVFKECSVCHMNQVETQCRTAEPRCNKELKCTLEKCKHEVRWRCGRDTDPRTENTCRKCQIQHWDLALKKQITDMNTLKTDDEQLEVSYRIFREACHNKILQYLPGLDILVNLPFETIKFTNFFAARMSILSQYKQYITKDHTSDILPVPHKFMSEPEYDDYQIVFQVLRPDNKKPNKGKQPQQQLQPDHTSYISMLSQLLNTPYGRGHKVVTLTDTEQLSRCPVDENGILHIVFGIAYSLRTAEGLAPFVTLPNNNTGNNKGNNKGNGNSNNKGIEKVYEQANKMAKRCELDGFDSIITDDDYSVYWKPSSVLPICYLELKVNVICCICREPHGFKDGFFCSKKHFICWANCFDAYVESAR